MDLSFRKHLFYLLLTNKTSQIRSNELINIQNEPFALSETMYCPRLGPNAPSETLVNCPCPMFNDAIVLKCPLGSSCVSRYGHRNPFIDEHIQGLNARLDGICKPCDEGEYCHMESGMVGVPKPCPAGYYCPDPKSKIICPSGFFCPEGSSKPKTCNYKQLLITDEYLNLPKQTVLDRIFYSLDPFNGNYCPGGATSITPTTPCPAGFFCPSPGIINKCPPGHYCRKQSTKPVKCGILTKCNGGTKAPKFSWWIVILFGGFTFVVVFTYLNKVLIRALKKKSMNMLPKSTIVNGLFHYRALIQPIKSLHYENLSVRSINPNIHPWLWSNSGDFKVCQLNAVMGSSGCGKSTLIELLRGRVTGGITSGQVHIKESERGELQVDMANLHMNSLALNRMRKLTGFVPQDDILLGELSVLENLHYSCMLKLPSFPDRRKALMDICNTVCNALGFDNELRMKIVGNVEKRGISGGQRKRVNIGMELVGLHPIIMMDEPTSGLDASGSQKLLEYLKEISRMGITFVTVVHQPRCSSFLLFDHVVLLSKHGLTFCGSPCEVIAYYHKMLLSPININDNPADSIMDFLTYGANNRCINQLQQAQIWKDKGITEIDCLRKKYPTFSSILLSSVEYTQDIDKELSSLGLDTNGICNVSDILKLFHSYDVFITLKGLKSHLHHIGAIQGDLVNVKHVKRTFRNICANASLDGKYDNPIMKLSLFDDINPIIVSNQHTDTHDMKIMALAAKFGYKLMKLASLQPAHITNEFTRSALLFVLTLKSWKRSINNAIQPESFIRERLARFDGQTSTNSLSKIAQTVYLIKRKLLCVARSPWLLLVAIPAFAAVIIGLVHGSNGKLGAFPGNTAMAMACIGVLSMVTHVRTFSLDKPFMRREVMNNASLISYFIAYNIVDMLWVISLPFAFSVPYTFLTFPSVGFFYMYTAGLVVCWWASGLSYILSSYNLGIQWVNLIAVFIAVMFGAFLNGLNPSIGDSHNSIILKFLLGVSYNRWATEGLLIRELALHESAMPNVAFAIAQRIGICGMKQNNQTTEFAMQNLIPLLQGQQILLKTCNKDLLLDYIIPLFEGLAFRVVGFLVMWCVYNTQVERLLTLLKHFVYHNTIYRQHVDR